MKHRLAPTPGIPTFVAMRVTEDQDKLGTKEDATYGSGVEHCSIRPSTSGQIYVML